jgi:hypothetical protein
MPCYDGWVFMTDQFFRHTAIFFFVLVWTTCCRAEINNVAAGKGYSFSPAPNYRLCTDPGDVTQLTDEKLSRGHWSDKNMVGWRYPREIPQITIDLERVCSIERVEIHTTAGRRGGVDFYAYAAVLVSLDGIDYRLAGYAAISDEIKKTAITSPGGAPYVHSIPIENTSGRFVKIIIQMETKMFFTDEITVIGTAVVDKAPENILPVTIQADYAYNAIKEIEDRREFIEAIAETQRFILDQKNKLPTEQVQTWGKTLQDMQSRYTELNLPPISGRQLEEAHGQLGKIRAEMYRLMYDGPFAVVQADPMHMLKRTEIITGSAVSAEVGVALWQHEYESLAFNVVNCSQETLRIGALFTPRVNGEGTMSSDGVFTLRRAEYVYGIGAGYIADPLVLQGNRSFDLPPGQACQLWVTVNSVKLPPGEYTAVLSLHASLRKKTQAPLSIPIRLQVQPIVMPDKMALNTYNWAYPTVFDSTRNHLKEAVADLRSHYINVQIIARKDIPFPKKKQLVAGKNLLGSTQRMDEWLRYNKDAKMFLLFLGFRESRKDSGFFGEWMTPSWKRNFTQWLSALTQHLKRRGIGYDRFALYPYDEYIGDDFYELSKLIKQIDPDIKIFANNYGKGPENFARLSDIVDIWCVWQESSAKHPDWHAAIKGYGRQVWTYDARGQVKLKSPFDYYRARPWWAFAHDVNGAGFWVYTDNLGSSWHEFGTVLGSYGVIYSSAQAPIDTHGEHIIPSRRWEAWREGVEDYQYLITLKDSIDRARSIAPEKAEKAYNMLHQHVEAVLAGDSNRITSARQDITSMILELERVTQQQ